MAFDVMIEQALVNIFGSIQVASIFIMFMFVILLVVIGLNVKMSVLATMPLGVAFSEIGWLNTWIGGLYWIFVVGFSLYTVWTMFQIEYG